MQAIILRCTKNSRFHLGETTEVQSNTLTDTSVYIHSDLLFAAFIHHLNLIEPSKTEVFINYFQNRQVAISSAFYCLEHNTSKQKIFFLPKPISLNLFELKKDDGTSKHKELKRIQFLSWRVWQEQLLPHKWFEESQCYIVDGRFVLHNSEINKAEDLKDLSIFKKYDSLKVCKHTQEDEGNLYNQTDLFLSGNKAFSVHWYFLCKSNLAEEDEKLFWQVWQSLIQTGIGGERSTGAGQMESLEKIQNLPDFLLREGSPKVALSLVLPKEEEKLNLQLYQTKLRGGMFLAENYRLKVAQAVVEGAIHSGVEGQILALHRQETDGIRLRNGLDFSIALPPQYVVSV